LQYINHSCEPTVFFDTASLELICLKPLQPGDELTFFYPSTEWDMSQPFVCNCQSPGCLQLINGASHLDRSTLNQYRLTDFIKQQSAIKHSI
jgi:SET domain